jgi:hypothetical protein
MKTITLTGFAILMFTAVPPFVLIAQTQDISRDVVAQSWKTGTGKVPSKRIHLKLSSKTPRFQQEIVGESGTKYFLQLNYMPYRRLNLEHWVVTLYEMTAYACGYRCDFGAGWLLNASQELLSNSRVPRDWSNPRQAYIGVIYPENDASKLQSDKQTKWFYPASTIRKINVEGFCVELKVKGFKFSKADPTRTDPLDLTIRFRPHCES